MLSVALPCAWPALFSKHALMNNPRHDLVVNGKRIGSATVLGRGIQHNWLRLEVAFCNTTLLSEAMFKGHMIQVGESRGIVVSCENTGTGFICELEVDGAELRPPMGWPGA